MSFMLGYYIRSTKVYVKLSWYIYAMTHVRDNIILLGYDILY